MSVIKIAGLVYGRLRSPDLDLAEQFLTDFGLIRAVRTPTALYTKAKKRFWRIFDIVARDSRRARMMPRRSPCTSAICALSMATSAPVLIAIPTSAAASAGASLMPSPATATR